MIPLAVVAYLLWVLGALSPAAALSVAVAAVIIAGALRKWR